MVAYATTMMAWMPMPRDRLFRGVGKGIVL